MGGILWTKEEDFLLINCIKQHGEGKWHRVPELSGLKRCRKSCRLRWLNYLRPNIKRGKFSEDEVDLILKLHGLLGNRWTLIAGRLPGRTANHVKNYWNHHLRKKPKMEAKHEHVQVIRPQATTIKPTSSLQQLLGFGFRPPEIMPMPFLYDEGAQELMTMLQDHGHDKEEEEDQYDACFEECGKIYRQLFLDVHEYDDLDQVEDHRIIKKCE